jgi:AraC-like DNA-binding protein
VKSLHSDFRCWQGWAPTMHGPHQHDDVEVNLVTEGRLRYLLGGTPVDVAAGQVAVFWAAIPHRLINSPQNSRSYVSWLHLPLPTVLQWGLPGTAVNGLLSGQPVLRSADDGHRLDAATFLRWATDLEGGTPELLDVVHLEIQAQLRRLFAAAGHGTPAKAASSATKGTEGYVTAMAQYAATHFREAVSVDDVAKAANLHPNYAMNVFHAVLGTTIGNYLTHWRVAEAQRLLITTAMTTNQVAAATGFGSASSFYAAFARSCRMPPGEYRRTYRSGSRTPVESAVITNQG